MSSDSFTSTFEKSSEYPNKIIISFTFSVQPPSNYNIVTVSNINDPKGSSIKV